MEETSLVACADSGEAGSVWRLDRLKELRFQLKALGLENEPSFSDLLSQIQDHTDALENLYEEQKKPNYQPPWWQDGEYDDARADTANERGSLLFREKKYGEAFDAFTEAIRLNPRSPVYPSNRSAAAIRIHRFDVALSDAQHSISRDPRYLKAYLRGGQAALELNKADEAIKMYSNALNLDTSSKHASKGLSAAQALKAQQDALRAKEKAAAARGARQALPRRPEDALSEEEAAQLLYTARSMLQAQPDLEAAKIALVEALILCHRFEDAREATKDLLPSPDKEYVCAEVAWRQGNVEHALEYLSFLQVEKIADLHTFLRQLHPIISKAKVAYEEEHFEACIEACSLILATVHPQTAFGLYSDILTLRAEAFSARGMYTQALDDLKRVLHHDRLHCGALLARSQVYKSLKRYTDSFLDLQKVKASAPGTPGLAESIQQAARLCLRWRQGDLQSRGNESHVLSHLPLECCQILGVSESPTTDEVRKAYLSLAAKWHPDKWSSGTQEEREKAEDMFKNIQKAYEHASGSLH